MFFLYFAIFSVFSFWNTFSVNQHFLWKKIKSKILNEKTLKTEKWENLKKKKNEIRKKIIIYIFVKNNLKKNDFLKEN